MSNIFNKSKSSKGQKLNQQKSHFTKVKNLFSVKDSFQDEENQIKPVNPNEPKKWEN